MSGESAGNEAPLTREGDRRASGRTTPDFASLADFRNSHGGFDRVLSEYRNFTIRWTGWKSNIESTNIAGQWLAWHEYGPFFYVNVPNFIGGQYEPGDHFNVAPPLPEVETLMHTVSGRAKLLEGGFKKLIRMIKDKNDETTDNED